jgi:hypothetical protein
VSSDSDDLINDIIRDAHSGRERTQDERVLAGLFGAVMVRARDEYDGEADLVIATLRAAGWRPPARTVSTVEELRALGVTTYLYAHGLDGNDDEYLIRLDESDRWYSVDGGLSFMESSDAVFGHFSPITVLWSTWTQEEVEEVQRRAREMREQLEPFIDGGEPSA